MPDIAAFTAILSGIKTATEITKNIRDADQSMQTAELKLKLAELMGALADIKLEAAGVQNEIAARDEKIKSLEEAFSIKGKVSKLRDAYYMHDANGNLTGDPYCMRCWDIDHKLFALHTMAKDRFVKVCGACRSQYDNMRAITIGPVSGAGQTPST